MPRWTVEVFKEYQGENWENRYYTRELEGESIFSIAQDIVTAERGFHGVVVNFTYVRVSTLVEGDNLFQNIPVNLPGLNQDVVDANIWPLFNVIRVDFGKLLSRPDFKLYRGCLSDSEVTDGEILPTFRAGITTSLDTIASGPDSAIVSVAGTPYLDVVVRVKPYQRDLHRRKRRKVVPQPV